MTKELDMYGIYRGVYQGVMKLANYGLGYHMPEYIAGRGFISKLPQILKDKGAGKVLVVTDGGLIKAGAAGKVLDLLKEAGIEYELFSSVQQNPTSDNVEEGFSLFREPWRRIPDGLRKRHLCQSCLAKQKRHPAGGTPQSA